MSLCEESFLESASCFSLAAPSVRKVRGSIGARGGICRCSAKGAANSDTFARETVTAICGRANPTLPWPDAPPDGQPRTCDTAKLVFAWLAEPKKWDPIPILPGDQQMRRELGLPLEDAQGRPVQGVSPAEIRLSVVLRQRLADLRWRADVGGKEFHLTDADKQLKALLDADAAYAALTFDPSASQSGLRRFYNRIDSATDVLKRMVLDLQAAKRISHDPEIRALMVKAADSWQKLMGAMRGERARGKSSRRWRRSAERPINWRSG